MHVSLSARSSLFAASFSTHTAKCLAVLLLSLENTVSAEISTPDSAKRLATDCCFLLLCTSAHARMFLGDVKL